MTVGDKLFLPSSSESASSYSPTNESTAPQGDSDGDGNVEWVVVQIERTFENLYPRSIELEMAEEKRISDLFTPNEIKALQHIRDSKSGTFDHGVCGIKKTNWSATGTNYSPLYHQLQHTILPGQNKMSELQNEKRFEHC